MNITNGFGAKNHIRFTFTGLNNGLTGADREGAIVFSAFCTENKYNGFYKGTIRAAADPVKLEMGPYIFCQIPDELLGFKPVKALAANLWLVERMSAMESPNYFLTSDFSHFSQLTDVNPQKSYNWLTAELISWKQFDGTFTQGILYKPENFDPHVKYPVIFNYYEMLTNRAVYVYEFCPPDFIHTDIDIPLFVSRGYIVIEADIHFSIAGKSKNGNGTSAYNSVVSGARFISRFPWVDSTKIGINGHSFGGAITYDLVTQSHVFAAAIASAGAVDGVSQYLTLGGPWAEPEGDRIALTEIGQGRMGVTLWQRPDLYLKNSAILHADKVITPILIMHNMKDYAVPWGAGS